MKIVARTGLDKKTVTNLIAQARVQAGVTIEKKGPVYRLEHWGPVFKRKGAVQALDGALKISEVRSVTAASDALESVPVVLPRNLSTMDKVWTCELILALGHGWVACTDALPWNDYQRDLEYIVYSPAYGWTCTDTRSA